MRFALFGRELERIARARWLPWSMCGLLFLFVLVIGLIWMVEIFPYEQGSFEARAALGATLFAGIWGTLLVTMILIVPIVIAGAIVGERQRGTGEVLATTPMSGLELVIGLAGPRLLALFMLAATAVPGLACCIAIGGVTIDELIPGLTAIGIITVWLSAMCIMLSATARNFQIALARGYAAVTCFGVILPVSEWLIWLTYNSISKNAMSWSFNTWINPIYLLFDWNATLFGIPQGKATLVAGVQSVICLGIAAMQVRGSLAASSRQVDRPRRVKTGKDPAGNLHSTRAPRALRPVKAGQNPLVWRELVAPERSRGILNIIARIVLVFFFILMFLPAFTVPSEAGDTVMSAVLAIQSFLLPLVAFSICIRLGGALQRERQAGRIESIMVTTMDRGRIFGGLTTTAWIGNRFRLLAILVLAIVGGIFAVAFQTDRTWGIPAMAGFGPVLATFVMVCLCTGIAAQATTRTRTIAGGIAGAIGITVALVIGYACIVIFALEANVINTESTEFLMNLNPIGAYSLVDRNWSHDGRFAIVLLGAIAWSLIGAGLWKLARHRFIQLPTERWLGGESGRERDDPDQQKPGDRPYVS